MSGSIEQERHWELLYNVRLGVRYHTFRQRFFNKWHRIVGVLSLIFSSTAVATFTSQLTISGAQLSLLAAAMVAILQALDLVIDTRRMGTVHNDLRRKYLLLEAELIKVDSLKDNEYATFTERQKTIECDEPPIMNALMDTCHQDVNRIYKLEAEEFTIPFWKGWTKNLFSWG